MNLRADRLLVELLNHCRDKVPANIAELERVLAKATGFKTVHFVPNAESARIAMAAYSLFF